MIRAELLKMLFKTLNVDVSTYDAKLFSDTPEGEWYTQYVIAGRARGTINGYPDGTFKPGQCVNRVEAIKMAILEFNDGKIPRVAGMYSDPYDIYKLFKDNDNPWWKPYYISAISSNTIGTEHFPKIEPYWSGVLYSFNFGPGEAMARKEAAEMLYRMKALKDNNETFYGLGEGYENYPPKPNNIIP